MNAFLYVMKVLKVQLAQQIVFEVVRQTAKIVILHQLIPQYIFLNTTAQSSNEAEPQAAQQVNTPNTKRKLFDYSKAREKLQKTVANDISLRVQIGKALLKTIIKTRQYNF
jgi:hypothetical protein